jgi:hypothetical protein
MKRVTSVFSIMAATLLISAMPVLGDAGVVRDEAKPEVGECLVANLDCRNQADVLQMRIENIKKELAKGEFTAEERQDMINKIDELNRNLIDALTRGGGA